MLDRNMLLKMGVLVAATILVSFPATAAEYRRPLPLPLPLPLPIQWPVKPSPVVHSAPGPVIGVGLPILAAAGGLIWLRRKRRDAPPGVPK